MRALKGRVWAGMGLDEIGRLGGARGWGALGAKGT